jgi:hypothetical protein
VKLTPSEAKLVELIKAMPGGSYCPGADMIPGIELQRLIRRLESTDDGPRYYAWEAVDG